MIYLVTVGPQYNGIFKISIFPILPKNIDDLKAQGAKERSDGLSACLSEVGVNVEEGHQEAVSWIVLDR